MHAARILAEAVALFAILSLLPVEGAYRTPSGAVLQGWLHPAIRIAWPLCAAALVAFSFRAWRRTGALLPEDAALRGRAARARALRPLAWLPALVALRHSSAWTGTALAGLALPLGVPAILAWVLERATRPAFEPAAAAQSAAPPPRDGRLRRLSRLAGGGVAAFLLAFAALSSVHLWQGSGRFVGGGDVVHYMTQLDNLLVRGNLDLTDRMERIMKERKIPDREADRREFVSWSHARRNAEGRVYSVHAWGYPVLAWPFAKLFGFDAGVSLLGLLLGALGIAGVRASSRRCGASRAAANWAAGTLCLSWFWAFTASSRLPEMLGCTLVAWAFWAVLARIGSGGPDAPPRASSALSGAVSAACCAYLPVAHMRFFPVAALLAAAWIAACAATPRAAGETRTRRIAALLLHPAAIALAWTALWRSHAAMFAGVSSFTLGDIFFSRPLAMLAIFADRRGVGPIFPLLWLAALAPAPFLLRPRDGLRAAAALALGLEATTLVACCAQTGAIEGACISGRYFLQAIPPLVPFGAAWLSRAPRAGRTWWFFLASIPVLYLFAISPSCSGGGLVHSPYGIWDFDGLRSFWQPFRSVLYPLPDGGSAFRAALCLVLPAATMAASALLAAPGRRRGAAAAAVLALGVAAGAWADSFLPPVPANPAWAFSHEHLWRDFRRISGPAAADFFAAFRASPEDPDAPRLAVFDGEPPPASADFRRIDVTGLRPNDWKGRSLHWTELRPFPVRDNRRGALAVRVRGEAMRGPARFAVSVGPEAFPLDGLSVPEGPFDAVFLVPTRRGRGSATVFGASDETGGAFRVDFVEIAPYAPGLEKAAGPFPAGSTVADCLRRNKPAAEPAP